MTEESTNTILPRDQRDRFARDGYLIIEDPGCPASIVDGAIADLEGLFEGDEGLEADGVSYSRHRITEAWKISENVRALALAPTILAMLEELYGRRARPFQTLNFRVGTEQRTHSDTIHFNSAPPGFMCGVWMALEDIDMDNGPVVYYPGSHKLPEITMEDVGAPPGKDHYGEYEGFIADLVEREALMPRYATIKKGSGFRVGVQHAAWRLEAA
jgi:hypothetical protein